MEFDGWRVNRVTGEISREGRSSRLPQQPLRILIELFDRAGEVVTREHLVRSLWPAGVVDFDNGLNVAVRKLRVALDDVGDRPRYIETLPRVGYRFVGKPLHAATAPGSKPRSAIRRRIGLAAGLAALAAAVALATGLWQGRDHTRHVPSERAQELYLEGLNQRARRDIDANRLSRATFEAALRGDPDYPDALAAYGEEIVGAAVRQEIPPNEAYLKARAAAKRAIALDPASSDAHNLLGWTYMNYERDFPAAKREFDRAIRLNDRSPRTWNYLAVWYGQTGRIDDALAAARRARRLEPMRLLYAGNYGLLLFEARRYDEAIAFLRPAIEASPKFDLGRSVLARALTATGDLAGALEHLQARSEPAQYQSELGVAYARLGRREDALREIERLAARGRAGYGVAYDQALIYVALGDLDKGCEMLARALTDHSLMVSWMRLEPRLDPIRSRQCFADAERRLYPAN